MNPKPLPQAQELKPEILNQIFGAIATLKYGTVEVTVHDGRVVQVERREKLRFKSE